MSGILIIRLKGLGDIVHLIPILRMLRASDASQTIGLLCQKPFGQIIPPELDIRIFELPAHAGIVETAKLLKKIRQTGFGQLYDLYSNPRTAIISLLSGIKKRYGFDYRIRRWAYSKTFSPPNPNLHLMYLFGDFFKHFGIVGELKHPALAMSETVRNKAIAAISKNGMPARPLLGINPHTTYPSKAWPEEYYIEFIKLWFEYTHKPILVTWGPGERQTAERIVEKAGKDKAFTHEAVKIDEFAALLTLLDLFLTADTGPMNIAWAVNTPTIALFGPTTREAVAPRGKQHLSLFNENIPCLQCHLEVCSHKSCMYEMKPEWVFARINEKYNLKHTDDTDE